MNKKVKKILVSALALSIIGATTSAYAWTYKVQPGDSYWKISQKTGVSIERLFKANNANQNTILYIGESINIPEDFTYHEVKWGDTPWLISQWYKVPLGELMSLNGLNSSSFIYPGQRLKIPNTLNNISTPKENFVPQQPKIYITYITHTVKSGDDVWKLSIQYGVTVNEILKANNMTQNTIIYIGNKLQIPVYNVPEMEKAGPQYGEYLDWWTGAQYLIPIGSVFKVIDFNTGKSFMVKRTVGANHADVEALTAEDTRIMKEIWGGSFSWSSRPAIIEFNGRRIAASVSGMPHAGNDSAPGGQHTSWRSGGYGAGINHDYVKGNGMDGHFDIHFLNSTRHNDGKEDSNHQRNVKIAAGLEK